VEGCKQVISPYRLQRLVGDLLLQVLQGVGWYKLHLKANARNRVFTSLRPLYQSQLSLLQEALSGPSFCFAPQSVGMQAQGLKPGAFQAVGELHQLVQHPPW
jgi:hypothetical protein